MRSAAIATQRPSIDRKIAHAGSRPANTKDLGYENHPIDGYRASNTARTGVAPGMVEAFS